MQNRPIDVDLPHKLGRDEARRRLADNIDQLAAHLPGQASVRHNWTGDTLNLDIGAMGQTVAAVIDVRETLVQAVLDSPIFATRWRWVTTLALAVPRNRNGQRLPRSKSVV